MQEQEDRKKIDARSSRILSRSLKKWRNYSVNFDVKSLMKESGLSFQLASRRTFSRHLNLMGYRFLQARKKGLLSDNDKKRRLCFARNTKRSCLAGNDKFFVTKSPFTWTVFSLYTNLILSMQR